jgi:rhamnosyltransferase
MPDQNGAFPEISIVLLTKNAGAELERTLDQIFNQRTSRPFEVLAVDSGSTDGTLEILRRFKVRVHPIPPQEFNFGRTRELGFELACGRYLVTLSQDCVPASADWLERLTGPFDDPAVAAVAGGPVLPPQPARIFYWERVGGFYFTRDSQRWLARYHFGFSNTNSAVRKAVWEQNRLGAVEMSEDKLLQKTWTMRGLRIVFVPGAAVYHAHDYDLGGLARRCENEGLGYRLIGESYSLYDCAADMLNLGNWWMLLAAIVRGARPTRAELLFPLIRPLFLWKGHRTARHYVPGR